jgi:hypothetical protein
MIRRNNGRAPVSKASDDDSKEPTATEAPVTSPVPGAKQCRTNSKNKDSVKAKSKRTRTLEKVGKSHCQKYQHGFLVNCVVVRTQRMESTGSNFGMP